MSYSVKWHEKAVEDLKSVDKKSAKAVIERVETYLSREPLSLSKPLRGDFKGLYRYRYGKHRIIFAVDREDNTIIILRVGKRKEIYDQNL